MSEASGPPIESISGGNDGCRTIERATFGGAFWRRTRIQRLYDLR
jgi:hypothetical protein